MKKMIMLCGLLFTGYALSAQDTVVVKKVTYPAGFTEQLNVVYTKVKDWEGKLDLYLPPAKNGPSPLVINIHGGGWNKGNKESQTGFSGFFKKGYAVANIAYRLTGVATAPAAVEDTRCALIYLISNAKKLNIDVNKIVIMGGSAGGHLALMGGLLENNHIFDTNCMGTEKIKVAAIIDKYGITDVWDWGYGLDKTSKSATSWLGAKAKDKDFAMSLSPLYLVKKTSPPVFIVHGDADPTVPYQQSVALKVKLDELGVKNEFVTVKGGQHGKFTPEDNAIVNAKIIDFLKGLGL
ncbi:MAG: alpha/beta hydrolase [Candidatus Pedobacter colombiensis]|uniref:Alpha/beta hydrolase n=1 Tax=Candidatus Pedobacter colombiensis TaxID=3121371 RepID=A0AAJ5W6R9_9SPHI|nr:alpha/beta hydrolase [Pedobacter sp.]WEK18029.1 MAG: alpha/beta hydrolase [Pedobacter sp.]